MSSDSVNISGAEGFLGLAPVGDTHTAPGGDDRGGQSVQYVPGVVKHRCIREHGVGVHIRVRDHYMLAVVGGQREPQTWTTSQQLNEHTDNREEQESHGRSPAPPIREEQRYSSL